MFSHLQILGQNNFHKYCVCELGKGYKFFKNEVFLQLGSVRFNECCHSRFFL